MHDVGGQDVIPKSIQLVAGRTAQEYNRRKKRKGTFWEDRYHATVIEDGAHLLRCIIYVDMNMVRAGVVDHPWQWPYGGYNEIRKPRRKCKLIDYDALGRLTGFDDFLSFQAAHKKWVIAELQKNDHRRESQWTELIVVGSESFVRSTRKQMRALAVSRRVRTSSESCELRETMVSYNPHFEVKKSDIGLKTTWFRYENVELSDG